MRPWVTWRRGVALLAVAAALAAIPGCGPRPGPAPAPDPLEVAPLPSPSASPGAWALEQEITIRHPEGANTFRAVLQKRGDELVLVILGPAGQRALVVTQRGTRVDHAYHAPMRLPFPPELMLEDVHRTWLAPTAGPPTGDVGDTPGRPCPGPDPCARFVGPAPFPGEEVAEAWVRRAAGWRLVRRVYRPKPEDRTAGDADGTAWVDYGPEGLGPGALRDAPPPDVVTFANRRFGYTATLRTIRWTPL